MAPQARLDVLVHVVELDLTEIPVSGPEDLLKSLVLIVERKAEPAELALPMALL